MMGKKGEFVARFPNPKAKEPELSLCTLGKKR